MRPKRPRRVGAASLTRATVFYLGATTAACAGEPTAEQAPVAPSISVEVAPALEAPLAERVDEPALVAALEAPAPIDVQEPPPDVSPGPAVDPSVERRARRRAPPEGDEGPTLPQSPIYAPATGYGGPPMHEPGVLEDTVRGRVTLSGVEGPSGGRMDSAIATRMIRTRLMAVRRCYEQQLRSDPTLSGRLTIEFTITQTGTITSATVQGDTVQSPAVAACITQTIRRFRFSPGPEDGAATFQASFELSTGL